MHYYDIAPTKIIRSSSTYYTYCSSQPLVKGQLVRIPVGNRQVSGVVLAAVKQPTFATKAIDAQLEATPLPPALLQTALWMSDYYATHLATVLTSILPAGLGKKRRQRQPITTSNSRPHQPLQPTPQQQAVIQAVIQSSHTTQLLHGVTGSGKTLVYIEAAKHCFAAGTSAIILVPEIALTSQLVDEFKQVFPDDVVVIHSLQTEAERHVVWQQCLQATTPKIVIGPRSALFAPLAKLGIIIIDEFHEPTYKQEQSPRYHALRVATMLARYHGATTLLGSATPSVSDYYLARHNKAPIHQLPKPAITNAVTPSIQLVNMKQKSNFTQHRFLSNQLLASIEASLTAGSQTLLFHNRRGTAALTICDACGWTATDPANDLPLTLHADHHQLISHISGYRLPVPTSCPVCGGVDILHKGLGTKLLETEIRKCFPNKKIVRFDGDTDTRQAGVHARYSELYQGHIDIIIGTQVVAKGLDLPHLRTVGVVQADIGLALPDYTADERTFQLLSQVIGRVGRTTTNSSVIIQSYQPDHPAIKAGLKQDFASFYQQAIMNRQSHDLPPFSYLLKLTCAYKTEAAAIKNSRQLRQLLQKAHPDCRFLGPAPAFYEKQAGNYRWQIIAKSPVRAHLQAIIKDLPPQHWHYELDPLSLL